MSSRIDAALKSKIALEALREDATVAGHKPAAHHAATTATGNSRSASPASGGDNGSDAIHFSHAPWRPR